MARKDREYDEILKGCKGMLEAIEDLKKAGKRLSNGASSAEATLKDRVGQKDIQAVMELADTIQKVTATGEERIRELEQKVSAEKAEWDELDRS